MHKAYPTGWFIANMHVLANQVGQGNSRNGEMMETADMTEIEALCYA